MSGHDAPERAQVDATTAQPAAPSLDYPPANLAGNSRQPRPRVNVGELVGGAVVDDARDTEPRPLVGSPEWAERILARTPKSRCPASRAVLVNRRSGHSFGVQCKSWSCSYCQKRKWVAVAALLYNGVEQAWANGERVRLVTLTDGSGTGMSVADISAAWEKLAKLLKRGGPAPPRPPSGSGAAEQAAWREACKRRQPYLDEYALVLEVGTNGKEQLHGHVLMTGRFIFQADLSRWAAACGFGRVADVREVRQGDAEEVSGYTAKQLAGYASKTGQALALAERAAERLRPVRLSRGWYGGGLRRAEEELGFRSPRRDGPADMWILVRHDEARRFVGIQVL